MRIDQVLQQRPFPAITSPVQQLGGQGNSFGDLLSKAIDQVNDLQIDAGDKVKKMVSGELDDLHEVMIAAEKAKTSFELLMEIRNKSLEAYREIMRMQV
jgi:flagellar hook-basal body complex protein FliE